MTNLWEQPSFSEKDDISKEVDRFSDAEKTLRESLDSPASDGLREETEKDPLGIEKITKAQGTVTKKHLERIIRIIEESEKRNSGNIASNSSRETAKKDPENRPPKITRRAVSPVSLKHLEEIMGVTEKGGKSGDEPAS